MGCVCMCVCLLLFNAHMLKVRTTNPNCLEGSKSLVHFSMFPMGTSKRGEMTPFVEAASKVYNDFASTMVINNFKFSDVAMFHHNGQEFDDNFGAWSDQHLAFATFLGVVDRVKGKIVV